MCDRIGLRAQGRRPAGDQPAEPGFLSAELADALELPKTRHVDTLDDCGNLFAAGIPVNLTGRSRQAFPATGDTVLMAAFAHAGDSSPRCGAALGRTRPVTGVAARAARRGRARCPRR